MTGQRATANWIKQKGVNKHTHRSEKEWPKCDSNFETGRYTVEHIKKLMYLETLMQ